MTEAMPFLQKAILLSYAPRSFTGGYLLSVHAFFLNLFSARDKSRMKTSSKLDIFLIQAKLTSNFPKVQHESILRISYHLYFQ